MLSLSEGGFGLETAERVEQGDSIRLQIHPQGGVPEVEVQAIVWYDHPAPRASKNGALRVLGCVVPDRPPEFLDLFATIERRNAPRERATRAERVSRARKPPAEEADADLPRSRAPLAPARPRPESEEALAGFRVRLRQIGGSRTKRISVQAGSLAQAAERVGTVLAGPGFRGADAWEVLEITPMGDPAQQEA